MENKDNPKTNEKNLPSYSRLEWELRCSNNKIKELSKEIHDIKTKLDNNLHQ